MRFYRQDTSPRDTLIPTFFIYIGDVFLNNPKVFICDTNFCHDSIMYFEHGFADRLTVEDTGACRVWVFANPTPPMLIVLYNSVWGRLPGSQEQGSPWCFCSVSIAQRDLGVEILIWRAKSTHMVPAVIGPLGRYAFFCPQNPDNTTRYVLSHGNLWLLTPQPGFWRPPLWAVCYK